MQPPSGGCVLKQFIINHHSSLHQAAAFGRLCVETPPNAQLKLNMPMQPPSGGCVLKLLHRMNILPRRLQPPSGGCVLKLPFLRLSRDPWSSSRLRAAVC